MEEKSELDYFNWKNTQDSKLYEQIGKDTEKIITLYFLYRKNEKAFQKINWLKEVLQWESTALDNLSIGPDRRWD